MTKAAKITFAAIIGVLLILLAVTGWQLDQFKTKYQVASVQLMVKSDSVTTLITKTGEAYAKVKSVTVERDAAKGSLDAMGIELKSLKLKNVNYKDLVEVLRADIKSSSKHDTIRLKDTTYTRPARPPTKSQTYYWTNDFLTLWGSITGKIMDSNYIYKTSIISATEQIGKKSVVTISLSDTNARIITGSQIVIIPAPTKLWEKPWVWGAVGLVAGHYVFK